MTSSRDLPWIGKLGRRARHDSAADAGKPRIDHYGTGFRPFGPLVTHAELMRIEDKAPDMAPSVDPAERELVALFLRRLVTYYARRRRFAQMGGAAVLLRGL